MPSTPNNPMTRGGAARIQSTQAKVGNDLGKGGFPARAQAAAAHNEVSPGQAPKAGGGGAAKSGGGGGAARGAGGGGGRGGKK